MSPDLQDRPDSSAIVRLVYELLDAGADTIELADELAPELRWEAHLDYLRALERKGRELLARTQLSEAT